MQLRTRTHSEEEEREGEGEVEKEGEGEGEGEREWEGEGEREGEERGLCERSRNVSCGSEVNTLLTCNRRELATHTKHTHIVAILKSIHSSNDSAHQTTFTCSTHTHIHKHTNTNALKKGPCHTCKGESWPTVGKCVPHPPRPRER